MENIQAHMVSAVPNGLCLERLLMFGEITTNVVKDVPVPVNRMLAIPD